MRKYIGLVIIIAFLIYGLVRLVVGSAMLGHLLGVYDFPLFNNPLNDVSIFLKKESDEQIIPMSVSGYIGYSTLMGLVLSIGAFKTLKNKHSGLYFIGAFLFMFFLLFVNFQTINQKVIHLGVCIILFTVLLFLKGVFIKK